MLFTVGHSTHPLDEFITLLQCAKIEHVVDVRTLAGSNKFPHFNEENLQVALPEVGIEYSRSKDLGGLRRKTPGVEPETNGEWRNDSFHRYADYALGAEFHAALAIVLKEAETKNVALMCAEAVWWRCHRRIIADHALAQSRSVTHIMPDGRLTPATLTPGAVITDSTPANVTYPSVT